MVEGERVRTDEGDVSAHECHGAQRRIADHRLRDGADRAAQQLDLGETIAGQRERNGKAIGNDGPAVRVRLNRDEVSESVDSGTSVEKDGAARLWEVVHRGACDGRLGG